MTKDILISKMKSGTQYRKDQMIALARQVGYDDVVNIANAIHTLWNTGKINMLPQNDGTVRYVKND